MSSSLNARFSLDFKNNNEFAASGTFLSVWMDRMSAGFANSLTSYVSSATIPTNCSVLWEFRTATVASTYSDATDWTQDVTVLSGRFCQVRGTLYKSDAASSGAIISQLSIASNSEGKAITIEESTTNLIASASAPVAEDVTVATGTVHTLSIWDNASPTGIVSIAHKHIETLTADFSAGTHSNTQASGDTLTLSAAIADPTFTRATAATKRDGTSVISGAARYEDVINQLLLTTTRDWQNGTLSRVSASPDGKLGVYITDDFDTDTSSYYTTRMTAAAFTPTFNTASGRLELVSTAAANAQYTYDNFLAANYAVEVVVTQAENLAILLRWQNTLNGYRVHINDDSSSTFATDGNIRVKAFLSGSTSNTTSAVDIGTWTRGTAKTIRAEIVDSQISVYVDGVLVVTVSTVAITSAGRTGLYHSSLTAAHISSFKIDDKTPLFVRNSVATNPQTGAAVVAGAPRYVLGKNLLTKNQSDIETNVAGFSNWAGSTSFSRYTTSAYSGTACLQVISDPATSNSGVYSWSDRIPGLVPAGSTVTASVYLTGNSGTVQMNCAIEYTDGTVTNNIGSSITVTPTWTRYSRSTAATAGKTISRVQIAVITTTAQTMTWYMDNLQIEVGATATTWVQGGPNAILIEEGTTNLCTVNTENFTTDWAGASSASGVVTSGQTDPFGGSNAYRITTTGGGSANKWYKGFAAAYTNAQKYSVSVWMKVNTAEPVKVNCNMAGLISPFYTSADGWKLIKLENATGNGASTQSIYFDAVSSSGALDFTAMWPQIEAKAYCTSYIAPGVIRGADRYSLASFPASSVASGSIIMRAYFGTDVITGTSANTHNLFFAYNNGSPYDSIRIVRAGTYLSARVSDNLGGSTDANWATVAITEGWHTVGMRWNGARTSLYFDGTEVASDTTSVVVPLNIPTASIGIGHGSTSQQWNHPIDDFNYYDSYLSDASMAALTTNS